MHMVSSFSLSCGFVSLISFFGVAAQAQLLTPGAAAIGGPTTDAPLIAPGGQDVQNGLTPITAPIAVKETPGTVHLPDPNWVLTLPPNRGNRGGDTTSPQPVSTIPSEQSPQEDIPSSSPVESVIPASNAGNGENPTTVVTAGGAEPEAGAPGATEINVTDETAPSPSPIFEQVALNFGPESVDLTVEHEIALGSVLTLMQANPLESLRVAAVLAIADASNEDAKLLARRRILVVRRYLIEQGVSAESLSFVISANSATEPFANHVLIERAGSRP